jgi:shikimate kinase
LNIVLTGFMGAGKTTVGRMIAERLGYAFVDMDEEIERATGLSVNRIFEMYGEAAFRERETVLTARLAGRDRQVVSCGGGWALNPGNVARMEDSSKLVYLKASPNTILRRTGGDSSRPLLNVSNREDRVVSLLGTRAPVYLSVADLVVDTDDITPEQVSEKILEEAEKWAP